MWVTLAGCFQGVGDTEISCRWLLVSIGSALIASNLFWAAWVKSLLTEIRSGEKERVVDLKESAKKLRHKGQEES